MDTATRVQILDETDCFVKQYRQLSVSYLVFLLSDAIIFAKHLMVIIP